MFHLLADARQMGSELTYPCFSQGPGGKAEPVEVGDKQLVLRLRFGVVTGGATPPFDPSLFQGALLPGTNHRAKVIANNLRRTELASAPKWLEEWQDTGSAVNSDLR